MPHVFNVSELTSAVKDVLEGQFPFVWVRGEVAGVSRPASGHIYFTLKDPRSVLNVVWFKTNQPLVDENGVDPATGEVVGESCAANLCDGQEVLCAGRLNVYPPRGTYQLVAEHVQEQGVGDLYLQFEALKKKLAELGWFAAERKRPLPAGPKRVAVVTSTQGAAIRDFLRIAGERGFGCSIRIHPTMVQGEAAPRTIAEAVRQASDQGWAELIVLIRGGGSIEDLWAFNTESVAAAIVESSLPVLTGVGHEIDTTIADLVADARAATPSHAAQMLWPERTFLMQRVDELEGRLSVAVKRMLTAKEDALTRAEWSLARLSPTGRLDRRLERLSALEAALIGSYSRLVQKKTASLEREVFRLTASFGSHKVEVCRSGLDGLQRRLSAAANSLLKQEENRLALLDARMSALDPEAPLSRGYSLVRFKADGRLLRAKQEALPGDELDIRTGDGSVPAVVIEEHDA